VAKTGLIGTVRGERREGRCPDRCKIGRVAPLDRELGLWPNQRTSAGLKWAACALAVFVPLEIAAVAALPSLVGADGVMVPFRPDGGKPNGRTVWREVKVAVLARRKLRRGKTDEVLTDILERGWIQPSPLSLEIELAR
jgi:hypothetical protein